MSEEEAIISAGEEEEEEEVVTDLSNSDVCTKYQEAAKITNLTLQGLVAQCLPGAKIMDLCQFGTKVLEAQVGKLYNKKVNGVAVERGVAFPVCISVNEIVCNFSPIESEAELIEPLKGGDIVKIDLGCHIDGYISVAAHTIVVPESADSPVTEKDVDSRMGNCAVAAYNAMLVASAAIKAGATNTEVTKVVERIAKHYGVNPLFTVRMHQMKRFVIDGHKEVGLRSPTPQELELEEGKIEDCTFEQSEVYAVDIAMSTGDGFARLSDKRTTLFKRDVETTYRLKLGASRKLLSEIDQKFPALPFTIRDLDQRNAKLGLTECESHGLIVPYPSLQEKIGEHVAHFKTTVLLLPSGTTKITGLDLPEYFKTDMQPDEESAKILEEIRIKAEKKAKKKAKKKKKN